jgi:hypothetical protein
LNLLVLPTRTNVRQLGVRDIGSWFPFWKKDLAMRFLSVYHLRHWVAACFIVLAILTGCNGSSGSASSSATTVPQSVTPSPTSVGKALPTFSDWRVAYTIQPSNAFYTILHVVSLDGKTDLTGPELPFVAPGDPQTVGVGFQTRAGVAPDGHTLAYVGYDAGMIDLASGAASPHMTELHFLPQETAWSPDSRYVAMTDEGGNYRLQRASDGSSSTMPGSPIPTTVTVLSDLLGWLDTTHILIDYTDRTHTHTWDFASVGIASGRLRTVASIPTGEDPGFSIFLSPDGKKILISADVATGSGIPYVPYAAIVDTATGVVTSLPNVAAQLQTGGFTGIARWRPGTTLIAVSTGFTVNHDLHDWLFDYQNDTLTPIAGDGYPAGWSPDGNTLILVSETGLVDNAPQATLTALSFNGNQETGQKVLTTQATAYGIAQGFPFWGFVRTASGN